MCRYVGRVHVSVWNTTRLVSVECGRWGCWWVGRECYRGPRHFDGLAIVEFTVRRRQWGRVDQLEIHRAHVRNAVITVADALGDTSIQTRRLIATLIGEHWSDSLDDLMRVVVGITQDVGTAGPTRASWAIQKGSRD